MIDLKPVLAEAMTDGQMERYINSDDWCAEQKLDGQRILVRISNGRAEFLQRQGKPTSKSIPQGVVAGFKKITSGEWYFDGELVAGPHGNTAQGVLWLFDMPLAIDKVSPSDPLDDRKALLDAFYEAYLSNGSNSLRLLPTAYSADDKALLVKRVKENGGEGVMFKHLDKPYDSGRRSRWVLKAKNWNSIDVIVTAVNLAGKDNIQIAVMDNGKVRIIGECTALSGDGGRIKPGDVVEVKYLYANDPRAPRLYQPTKPMLRDDKDPVECTIDQLVFCNKGVLT